MEKKRMSSEVKEWGRFLKSKMVFARLAGLLFCLVCAGTLALLYFKVFSTPWVPIIVITFSMACIFIANSFLQNVKRGRMWQVINLLLAFVCYAAVITFVTLAFIEGALIFSF